MPHNQGLQVSIVTPEGKTYEESRVKTIIAPAILGEVAILPDHIPLFTKLRPGEVTIKGEGQEYTFAVFGGFMDVSIEGQVTILADFAKRSKDIDLQSARQAQSQAEKLMQKKNEYSKDEFARIETSLKQALFAIKIAEKRKGKSPNH